MLFTKHVCDLKRVHTAFSSDARRWGMNVIKKKDLFRNRSVDKPNAAERHFHPERHSSINVNTQCCWKDHVRFCPADVCVGKWCWDTFRPKDWKTIVSACQGDVFLTTSVLLECPPKEVCSGIVEGKDAFDIFLTGDFLRKAEACLHPLLQDSLTDFLVRVAESKKQVPDANVISSLSDPAGFVRRSCLSSDASFAAESLVACQSHLIKWGMSVQYGLLLASARVSPFDASFGKFVDDLGCERVACFRLVGFGIQNLVSLDTSLVFGLAPASSFWRLTLSRGNVRKCSRSNCDFLVCATDCHLERVVDLDKLNLKIRKLYEDDGIIVIDKSAGLATVGHSADPFEVISWILAYYPQAREVQNYGIAQRLDAETSGVMVIAKTNKALNFLKKGALKNKTYVAVCRDLRSSRSCVVVEKTKSAHGSIISSSSTYVSLKYYPHSIVALRITISSGKKHQIRRHLSSAHMPILNDTRYGVACSSVSNSNRMMLHARSVTFQHPETDNLVTFNSKLPVDIVSFLKALDARRN